MTETIERRRHVRYTIESDTETNPREDVIPVTQPAPRRREHTRARLLEAALDVFVEKGLKRVTVDDLVGAAGFTRGAFYSNFSSIEEVFCTVFEEQSRAMIGTVRDAVRDVPAGEFSLDSLRGILDSMLPLGRTWYIISTEFTLLALRNEEARQVCVDHHHLFQHEMEELIGDVLARLGREPTLPIEKMTETAVALYLHSLANEFLGTGSFDTATLVEVVMPQVLLGLSRPVD